MPTPPLKVREQVWFQMQANNHGSYKAEITSELQGPSGGHTNSTHIEVTNCIDRIFQFHLLLWANVFQSAVKRIQNALQTTGCIFYLLLLEF